MYLDGLKITTNLYFSLTCNRLQYFLSFRMQATNYSSTCDLEINKIKDIFISYYSCSDLSNIMDTHHYFEIMIIIKTARPFNCVS